MIMMLFCQRFFKSYQRDVILFDVERRAMSTKANLRMRCELLGN